MTKLEAAIRQVSDLREFYVRLKGDRKTDNNPEKVYNKAGRERVSARGPFHVGALIENHADRKQSFRVGKLLVDTGSEHTWLPESLLDKIGVRREKKDVSFVMANGTIVTRSIGFVIVHVEKFFTIDEVVFAEKGDRFLLGARTLEGLNLTVNPTRKRLVASGPIPAA
jgi:predicted aspartyl protease